jgi:acetylornithine deacetylase/succinyl-diaminopimelate desuccinylase-like protein
MAGGPAMSKGAWRPCSARLPGWYQERPARSANVVLAFSVDEEHTFLGVQRLGRRAAAPAGGGARPPQYAVVAEPTLLNIVNAHKGVTRWELSTAGRSCHSSRPHDGINAIYRMARLLVATERYAAALAAQPPHPQLGPPTLSVGRVEGGISVNTVPDACRAEIDRRLLPGESAEEAVAHFRNALAQAEPQTPVHLLAPLAILPRPETRPAPSKPARSWGRPSTRSSASTASSPCPSAPMRQRWRWRVSRRSCSVLATSPKRTRGTSGSSWPNSTWPPPSCTA